MGLADGPSLLWPRPRSECNAPPDREKGFLVDEPRVLCSPFPLCFLLFYDDILQRPPAPIAVSCNARDKVTSPSRAMIPQEDHGAAIH